MPVFSQSRRRSEGKVESNKGIDNGTFITYHFTVVVWLGGRVVRTLDLRSVGREFESWPLRYRVQPWTSC